MDLISAIYDRRSIRKYTDKPIKSSDLNKLLEAARWSPNAGNKNAWRFIVITDADLKKTMLNFMPGVNDTPAAIILISIEPSQQRVTEATRLVHMADSAIAAQNIALTAYSMGIGSCIVASFADVAMRALLNIPENISPYIAITLGYPNESPKPPPRRSINKISFLNAYGKSWQS